MTDRYLEKKGKKIKWQIGLLRATRDKLLMMPKKKKCNKVQTTG